MTDEQIIARCREIVGRGDEIPGATHPSPYGRKRTGRDDDLEVRYLLPALLEVVLRRGLKD